MSKQARNSGRRCGTSIDTDDVEHGQQSASQPSTSGHKAWDLFDPAERKQKVNALVRYLLLANSQKSLIKRDELIKTIMGGKSKAFNSAISCANEHLKEVFGVEAIETKKGTQIVYVLVNCLPEETKDKLIQKSDIEVSRYGLLGIILSLLLMRPQQTATEENIWSLLNRLGFASEISQHPVFGSVKELLAPFIEQGYIVCEKNVVGETTVIMYRWGPRAKLEVDKRELLKVMAEIHGDDFDLWERQFSDIITE